MSFGLKTFLAEEAKQYNVVLVKKKVFLKEGKPGKTGDNTEWTLQNSGFSAPLDTLHPDMVLVGMRVEHGRYRYIQRIWRKTGEVGKQEYIDFSPTEFEELVKLGAFKGLA